MNRRVLVHVCATNQRLEAHGLAAEVIALVALLPLSDRTLGLLLTLAMHEDAIAALAFGRIEADLTPKRAAVYHRKLWQRKRLGDEEDTADGP